MSSSAIRAVDLGKRYRIGAAAERCSTLGDALSQWARAPLRNLRQLRRLSRFEAQEADDVFWALRDVSFEVREGEALGVVGRNGAGKSTLLKVLSRVTDPTTGFADVAGRVSSLLEVGTGFHPELSGRDNVYLNGSILGMDRRYIDKRFDEIVEFAAVARFIDTPVKWYSSGMRLRLAFAVAAHLEPEILIIDEVLAVGDAEFQRKCIGRMDTVTREGRTVLLVSHDLTIVQRLCPRCVLLEDGRLVAEGGTSEVLARYLAHGPDHVVPERWIDVSAVPRQGTGEAALRAVWFSSLDPQLGGLPYTYGPLEIKLDIYSAVARKVDRFLVWVSNPEGTRLLVIDSMAIAGATRLSVGHSIIGIHIPRLNLNPGSYVLNFKIRNLEDDVYDHLEPLFRFQVVDVRSGRPGAKKRRLGVVPCEPDLTGASLIETEDG